jgi:hypothetical protein
MTRDRFTDTFDRFQPPERGRFGDNEMAQPRSGPRVTGASDLKDLELHQHAKTAKAVLVSDGKHGSKPQWLPLSEVEIVDTGRSGKIWNDDRRSWAPIVIVTLPEWLAREKRLI